jgi:hypothetical protein
MEKLPQHSAEPLLSAGSDVQFPLPIRIRPGSNSPTETTGATSFDVNSGIFGARSPTCKVLPLIAAVFPTV